MGGRAYAEVGFAIRWGPIFPMDSQGKDDDRTRYKQGTALVREAQNGIYNSTNTRMKALAYRCRGEVGAKRAIEKYIVLTP